MHATITPPPPPPARTVTLEMTERDACALRSIMGSNSALVAREIRASHLTLRLLREQDIDSVDSLRTFMGSVYRALDEVVPQIGFGA